MAHKILPLTIKIAASNENETFVDLVVERFEDINFQNLISFICKQLNNENLLAFDYRDEDGDLITVRSDEELIVMLSSHCYKHMEPQALYIYPKLKKSLKKKKQLKVDVRECMEVIKVEGSNKKSENIGEILQVGAMNVSDVEILSLLGSGNCASVYLGKHTTTQEKMAVKLIPLDVTRESQEQIISELGVLHQCKCDVIISFIGAFFYNNNICICTEYMDGGSLDKYEHIPEEILGSVSACVVRGLTYLWSLKILHRDVKPSNILINTEGLVKLCDFGVSVQLIDSIAKTFIGTNAYMAPERIQGHDYGIHSEVWSLGVSLFELAAGHFPYGQSIGVWRSIVLEEPPVLPSDLFSAHFVDFVSKCMKKEPQERPKPEALIDHPFLRLYNHCKKDVVSTWVTSQLEKRNNS